MRQFYLEWNIGTKDAGKTVKQFLKEQKISRSSLINVKYKGGKISIDGRSVTVRHRLATGEKLTILFPNEEPSRKLVPERLALSILYEDEYLLVVNKPPFMNTIPSPDHPSGSLAGGLLAYYKTIGLETSPHIVTRLDRNTSGLVLVAKYSHIHHLLNTGQDGDSVKREYEAFAEGQFLNRSGIIEAPIARKPGSIIERIVSEDGKFARTRYEVIRQYDSFAHVRVILDTGRTHQIRVHMAHIGHPLMGDDLYGGNTEGIQRQALHCNRLTFVHPVTNQTLQFTAELHRDMKAILTSTLNNK